MANELMASEEDAFEMAAELAQLAEKDAGHGNENLSSQDIAIPYISILQPMSPQVNEDHDAHIAGAKAGMFFQNVNYLVFEGKETGIEVVPCAYDRKVIEWVPRDAGGGLVAVHEVGTPLMNDARPNDKGIPTLPNGHNLIETAQHYILYPSPISKSWEPAVISMKSTALKKSRQWNSLLSQQVIPNTQKPAPRWLFRWKMTTVKEQRDNNIWHNFEFERAGLVSADVYQKAKTLYESFRHGGVKTADAGSGTDDEIPF
jgi:hypothetical protein